MNNIKELKAQYSGKHPAFGLYLECMTRALLLGLSSFTIAFSATYIPQSLLKVKYSTGGKILSSAIIATCVSYYISSVRTKSCQSAWMAAEDKHSSLS